MGDITKNFSYSEFRPKKATKSWMPTSEYQKLLIDELAENLQVVRSEMPSGYMKITSGVRDKNDYERLKRLGYNPSRTSDHNCGLAIELPKHDRKYKKFGDTYNFAVGAADVVPVGMSAKELFNLSVKLVQGGKCNFGQVIYEKDPNSGAEWVHYGNSLKDLFAPQIIDMINRTQFMKTTDGGRTYSVSTSV